MQHFVRRSIHVLFRHFNLGDVRRKLMQRRYAAFHCTLASYLHDALHKGTVDAVARLHVPRAYVWGFSSLLPFAWWLSLLFLVNKIFLVPYFRRSITFLVS
jgi:hypothetical protein